MRPQVAYIREDICIGCTKCIDACPTDAIIGATHMTHTVVTDLCIGCDLCVPPCPMNCIDMLSIVRDPDQEKINAREAKERIQSRIARLKKETLEKQAIAEKLHTKTAEQRKAEISAALLRVKRKKD